MLQLLSTFIFPWTTPSMRTCSFHLSAAVYHPTPDKGGWGGGKYCRLMTSHQMFSNYSTISVSWPTMEWWKTRQPSQPQTCDRSTFPTEFSTLSLIQGVQNLAAKHFIVSFNFSICQFKSCLLHFTFPSHLKLNKSSLVLFVWPVSTCSSLLVLCCIHQTSDRRS